VRDGDSSSQVGWCGVWDGSVAQDPEQPDVVELPCAFVRIDDETRGLAMSAGLFEAARVRPERLEPTDLRFDVRIERREFDAQWWRRIYAGRPVLWTGAAEHSSRTSRPRVRTTHPPVQFLLSGPDYGEGVVPREVGPN